MRPLNVANDVTATDITALRILVINAAPVSGDGGGMIAFLQDGHVVKSHALPSRGASDLMAARVQEILQPNGRPISGLDAIVVVRGPGSFTGLRASLALAEGLAAGYGCRLHGVTLSACYSVLFPNRELWCITKARQNRVFVQSSSATLWAGPPEDVVLPSGARVVGDGVASVRDKFATLVEVLDDGSSPLSAQAIAIAGLAAPSGRYFTPLYIDPPEAKPPSAGFRPHPIS